MYVESWNLVACDCVSRRPQGRTLSAAKAMDTGFPTPGTSVFNINGISSRHTAHTHGQWWCGRGWKCPARGTTMEQHRAQAEVIHKWHCSVATGSPTTCGCQVQSRYACAREEEKNSRLPLGKTGSTGLGWKAATVHSLPMAWDQLNLQR